MDAGCLGYILECAVALIMKEHDTIAGGDCQIGMAIVIVVAGGASDNVQCWIEAGFLCDIFEFAPTGIAKKRDASLRSRIRKEQIRMAIIVKIQKACSGANLICSRRFGPWRRRRKGSQS